MSFKFDLQGNLKIIVSIYLGLLLSKDNKKLKILIRYIRSNF